MMILSDSNAISGSFRDPSGFIFVRYGSIYRQVNMSYKNDYDYLLRSGLYQALVTDGLLIPHQELDLEGERPEIAYKIIKPKQLSFISYPYEWCFSQLKDSALTSLEIQKRALEVGMSLKDCSAYNIQFFNGAPILIDTLSFEIYQEGQPWVAYRQFCQHFLAPLALMSFKDVRLSQLLRIFIDGIPLDLTSELLPWRTRFKFPLLVHIHLHAKSQKHFAAKSVRPGHGKMSRRAIMGLLDSLAGAVRRLQLRVPRTEWENYYEDNGYSSDAFQHKKQLVSQFLDLLKPKNLWDLGANTGTFSRIAADKGIHTVAWDLDPVSVEKNYAECVKKGETRILPLMLDLTNPSSGLGWGNQERMSLLQRGPADTVLALALIHHLAIANNVPFREIAEFLSHLCSSLLIEFVPKTDSQVQRMLATREDIFFEYSQPLFESAFGQYFTTHAKVKIIDTQRELYLMQKRTCE